MTEPLSAGDVVMCIWERPSKVLRKGHLYRIASRFPQCLAYKLEGVREDGVGGYWNNHFGPPLPGYTRSGPIRRAAPALIRDTKGEGL